MLTLPVKSTDRVLEVGSGHNPHPRSNVLCDSHLFDGSERQRLALRYDRPLVIAKGEKLPFKDQSFDFVLCSQVLEHAVDPLLFTQELTRVAKAGVIIVPHILRERLFGWYYHRWFFFEDNDTLCYLPKEEQEQTQFAHFIHHLFQHFVAFRRYLSSFDRKLNIYYFWKESINIQKSRKIKDKLITETDQDVDKLLQGMDYNWKEDIRYWIEEWRERLTNKWEDFKRQKAWDHELEENPRLNIERLTSLMCCVHCGGELVVNPANLICLNCQTVFEIEKGIPVMREELREES